MNYIDQETERMLWEFGAILLFMPVLRLVLAILTVLGIYDVLERRK